MRAVIDSLRYGFHTRADLTQEKRNRVADLLASIVSNKRDFERVRGMLMEHGREALSSDPELAEQCRAAEAILRATERDV